MYFVLEWISEFYWVRMFLKYTVVYNFGLEWNRRQSRTTEFKHPLSDLFGLDSDDSCLYFVQRSRNVLKLNGSFLIRIKFDDNLFTYKLLRIGIKNVKGYFFIDRILNLNFYDWGDSQWWFYVVYYCGRFWKAFEIKFIKNFPNLWIDKYDWTFLFSNF